MASDSSEVGVGQGHEVVGDGAGFVPTRLSPSLSFPGRVFPSRNCDTLRRFSHHLHPSTSISFELCLLTEHLVSHGRYCTGTLFAHLNGVQANLRKCAILHSCLTQGSPRHNSLAQTHLSQVLHTLTRPRVIMAPRPVVPSPFLPEPSLLSFQGIGNVAPDGWEKLERVARITSRQQEFPSGILGMEVEEEVTVGRVLNNR